ncbi:MAG: DNA replication protein [Alphaproteobacteria bacterium]|nr:DNA replication protein [Alphaproteobacteria bacterium]
MADRQLVLDLPHRPAQGREDFLVAATNADAVAWIDRWPGWQGGALALYGPKGCGKSHLAEVWRSRSDAYLLDSGDLTRSTVPDIAASGAVILDRAEAVPDDVALLHLINLLRQDGGALLCLSLQAPGHWPVRLADLRSRLAAMQSVGIAGPDDSLLGAVMWKLLSDRQLRAPIDVISFLVPRIERSFAAANLMVALLDRLSAGERRPVSIALAREALAEIQEIRDTGQE